MRILIPALAATLMMASAAQAMDAKQTIEREVSVTQADGTVSVTREPAALVKPGDALIYTLDFVNTEAEPVSGINMAMPVPAEVRFVEPLGAPEQTLVNYSADGGASFASREALQVRGEDGVMRAASADDITHVRWTVQRAIAVGERGAVSFRGQLR